MTAAFTIILPHKRNPGNDRALSLCIDLLLDNTVNDFILLVDAAVDSAHDPRVNTMFEQAPTDCCVYWNSDMFAAPDWDVPMLACWDQDTLVNNTLVEPGMISMFGGNAKANFGRTPDEFNREQFEAWCKGPDRTAGGVGWYAPYMISRERFFEIGGLDTAIAAGADIALFERWQEHGYDLVRAPNSFTYHLQKWSDEAEQTAGKRHS